MKKLTLILLSVLQIISFCACGQPEKEPVVVVCRNDIFSALYGEDVEKISYVSRDNLGNAPVYKSDVSYAFVKYLKEATFQECLTEDGEAMDPTALSPFLDFEEQWGTYFTIYLKNGDMKGLHFYGKYFTYDGHTYTGYPDDLSGNLRALFDA